MKILLSIAIPVYNGANTISETINSILLQLESGVEIVVSDNASTDATSEIVNSLKIKHPEIKYFKNKKNLGADNNIDLVVRRSAGEYVWLMGSDDEIRMGGISNVLDIICKNKNLSSLFVNYGLYNRATSECVVERVLDLKDDILCTTSDKFLDVVTIYPNFMSSIVVRRSLWNKIDHKKYIGSFWMQYAMLMELSSEGNSYCVANPYVQNKGVYADGPNDANKNGVALGILLNLVEILSSLNRDYYSEISIKRAIDEAYKLMPSKISSSKRNGLKLSITLFKRMNLFFGDRLSFWTRDIVLLMTPKFLHWMLWKIYKIRCVNNFYWKFIR